VRRNTELVKSSLVKIGQGFKALRKSCHFPPGLKLHRHQGDATKHMKTDDKTVNITTEKRVFDPNSIAGPL
jgi:hypothetical protein